MITLAYSFGEFRTVTVLLDMNESDPRSDVHYLGSSENKA